MINQTSPVSMIIPIALLIFAWFFCILIYPRERGYKALEACWKEASEVEKNDHEKMRTNMR